ncbi:MAG: TlpA disulfide reductase family protein, partial [Verrucomicrobiales bacterium]
MIRLILSFASLILLFCDVVAEPMAPDTPGLKIGVDAPALKLEKWLKGEAVTAFAKDKVYLVECWATWCGPCVAQIPHLNDLHHKFKDQGLIVIGVNVMGDPEEKAAAFVARKGDKMSYRVAYDGKSGDVEKHWLKAAGVRGIPHSFLVREGKVIWHGHPGELTEEA